MSKSNSWENGVLELLFKNTNFANAGDVTGLRGSTTAGSLYVSLHTGDPGEAGSQTTNEIAYTGYGRVGVARSGSGWVVTNNSVSPVANVSFTVSSGGAGGTVTYFGVGTDSSGAGTLLYSGTVTPSIVVTSGVTPILASTSTITED